MTPVRHLLTNTIHNTPQDVIEIVRTHYTKEQQRSTPDHLPQAPWTQPQNPGSFEVILPTQDTSPHPTPTLDTYIIRGHYDKATTRAPEGKAHGPDAITNELIKHLPEATHTLLYTLFRIMTKTTIHQRSGAEALPAYYNKPNKKHPHNIAYYRPITLMNGILKLWTSILTNIGSPWVEAHGILSDTAYGFRRHKKIYDSLSTHIMIYEDAKMTKNTYTRPAPISKAHSGAWIAEYSSKP